VDLWYRSFECFGLSADDEWASKEIGLLRRPARGVGRSLHGREESRDPMPPTTRRQPLALVNDRLNTRAPCSGASVRSLVSA